MAFYYENYCFKRCEYGPVIVKAVCNFNGGVSFSQTLNVEPFSEVPTTNWVKNYGSEYQVNMFVSVGMFQELPVFKIFTIVLHGECAFFIACDVYMKDYTAV